MYHIDTVSHLDLSKKSGRSVQGPLASINCARLPVHRGPPYFLSGISKTIVYIWHCIHARNFVIVVVYSCLGFKFLKTKIF